MYQKYTENISIRIALHSCQNRFGSISIYEDTVQSIDFDAAFFSAWGKKLYFSGEYLQTQMIYKRK